jgi:hypothetical protein
MILSSSYLLVSPGIHTSQRLGALFGLQLELRVEKISTSRRRLFVTASGVISARKERTGLRKIQRNRLADIPERRHSRLECLRVVCEGTYMMPAIAPAFPCWRANLGAQQHHGPHLFSNLSQQESTSVCCTLLVLSPGSWKEPVGLGATSMATLLKAGPLRKATESKNLGVLRNICAQQHELFPWSA